MSLCSSRVGTYSAARPSPSLCAREVTDAVIEWSSMLHSKNMELILVIPSQLRGSVLELLYTFT